MNESTLVHILARKLVELRQEVKLLRPVVKSAVRAYRGTHGYMKKFDFFEERRRWLASIERYLAATKKKTK